MDLFIRKLLYEALELSAIRAIYLEGKKYFPNLQILSNQKTKNRIDQTPEVRVFLNPQIIKGSMSLETFKSVLAGRKIWLLKNWLVKKGIEVRSSNTTYSIYFTLNNREVRISEHKNPNRRFNKGVEIIVEWDTSSQEVVDKLNSML